MADKIFEVTDSSGRITTAVFRQQAASDAAHFTDFEVNVDNDMVVVGGGGVAKRVPVGALLTASYPNDSRSAWRVSSKDHLISDPHRLTAFAIGIKIQGLNRAQVLENLNFRKETSARTAHPALTVGVPDGFTMISGGFRVNWQPGAGNLATASAPEFENKWRGRSKDHFEASPATIDVWAISIRTQLPMGFVTRDVRDRISGVEAHPSVGADLPPGSALCGIGAAAQEVEPGSLLWRLEPRKNNGLPGVVAGSKDHKAASPASIKAWAIGIHL